MIIVKKSDYNGYIKSGKVLGPIYFVGTRATSAHLIDTGDGLILLDTVYPDALWLLTDNINELGFDIKDIKIILLSHGHYDHTATAKAIREMSGAKIYISGYDRKMVTGEEDPLLLPEWTDREKSYFTPDICLKNGDIIKLGNIEITCLSTPGHTDGTMSFFFDVSDGENLYRAGMFGGAGTNTLTEEVLTRFNLPFENRKKFLKSLELLSVQKVEVFLGNHVENNKTDQKLEEVRKGKKDAFIVPNEWNDFLESRRKKLFDVIRQDKTKHIF